MIPTGRFSRLKPIGMDDWMTEGFILESQVMVELGDDFEVLSPKHET